MHLPLFKPNARSFVRIADFLQCGQRNAKTAIIKEITIITDDIIMQIFPKSKIKLTKRKPQPPYIVI